MPEKVGTMTCAMTDATRGHLTYAINAICCCPDPKLRQSEVRIVEEALAKYVPWSRYTPINAECDELSVTEYRVRELLDLLRASQSELNLVVRIINEVRAMRAAYAVHDS